MNKSSVAGILTIVSGVWSFLYALGAILYGVIMAAVFSSVPNGPPAGVTAIIAVFAGLYALFFTALGVLAIIGGIFAFRRKRWGIALAGAIAGNIAFMPMGVIAVIFISMAKSEFDAAKAPGVVAAAQ
jgi:hypothetical protein